MEEENMILENNLTKPIALWYKQLFARVIDLVVVSWIIFGIVWLFSAEDLDAWGNSLSSGLAYQLVGMSNVLDLFEGESSKYSEIYNSLIGFFVITIVLSIFDYFSNGQSLGNYIFGLKVIQLKKTSSLSFFVSFFRNSLRIIPFSLFSYLGARPRGFHNLICQTKVIDLTYNEEGQNSFFGKEVKLLFRHLIFLTKGFFSRSKITNSDLKKLNEIFDLKEKGALSQEEYEKFKDEILKK